MNARFRDRADAGRKLAARLGGYTVTPGLLVLALPRGGVPVAFEVAQRLGAPLDLFTVRKLGVPGHEELAMGAIATGGAVVLNHDVIESLEITPEQVRTVAARESLELTRREALYRRGLPPTDIAGRTVMLVDDGLATGATMRVAVKAVREARPRGIAVAVPVGATDTCESMWEIADDVVCVEQPQPFHGVGMWYHDFSPTSDEEVSRLLSVVRMTERRAS